ncbi:MAG: NTP transferase domain-containing protein [Ruminococcus flavefaciens]|nr:NTP transferase domain-containing protein [Ruminococcus flavefaciens]
MEHLNEIKEVIILAAGRSRRMEHLSKKNPKCLLTYNNEIILLRLIRQIKECGISKIVVTVGYKHNKIEQLLENEENVTTVYNDLYEEDVNIYSMKLALEHISDSCVIFEADTIMEDALVKYVLGADFNGKSVWFTRGLFKSSQYGGILKADKHRNVTEIKIQPVYEPKYHVWQKLTGLMRIHSKELNIFRMIIDEYAKSTIKQYYLIPWIEHIADLPSIYADISPYTFYTFNKPEEYYQLSAMDIDIVQPTPEITLLQTEQLFGIEAYDENRVVDLIDKINNDNIWKTPIIVEKNNMLVLDGQHRLESAKRMHLTHIPSVLVSYKDVDVWSLRAEEKVNKKLVAQRALEGNIYPYKTVKHKFPFRIPEDLQIPVSELMK